MREVIHLALPLQVINDCLNTSHRVCIFFFVFIISAGKYPTPSEVIECLIGSYCLERLGMSAPFKTQLVAYLRLSEGVRQRQEQEGREQQQQSAPTAAGSATAAAGRRGRKSAASANSTAAAADAANNAASNTSRSNRARTSSTVRFIDDVAQSQPGRSHSSLSDEPASTAAVETTALPQPLAAAHQPFSSSLSPSVGINAAANDLDFDQERSDDEDDDIVIVGRSSSSSSSAAAAEVSINHSMGAAADDEMGGVSSGDGDGSRHTGNGDDISSSSSVAADAPPFLSSSSAFSAAGTGASNRTSPLLSRYRDYHASLIREAHNYARIYGEAEDPTQGSAAPAASSSTGAGAVVSASVAAVQSDSECEDDDDINDADADNDDDDEEDPQTRIERQRRKRMKLQQTAAGNSSTHKQKQGPGRPKKSSSNTPPGSSDSATNNSTSNSNHVSAVVEQNRTSAGDETMAEASNSVSHSADNEPPPVLSSNSRRSSRLSTAGGASASVRRKYTEDEDVDEEDDDDITEGAVRLPKGEWSVHNRDQFEAPAHIQRKRTFLQMEVQWYSADDYLGWDPRAGPPPADHNTPDVCTGCGMANHKPNIYNSYNCDYCGTEASLLSPWRLMTNALVNSFYAERAGNGISFGGARYCDVLQWLPLFRPYHPPSLLPKQSFIDQVYLVTHVVLTLSNWGELSLHPSLLPHEFYFLREHLPWHIANQVRCDNAAQQIFSPSYSISIASICHLHIGFLSFCFTIF